MQKPTQEQVKSKEPTNSNPKYICAECGRGYYSAASLDALYDPNCNECGGKLVPYKEKEV